MHGQTNIKYTKTGLQYLIYPGGTSSILADLSN